MPLSMSDLLVNAEGQPNIGSELRLELESADSVDLLCAFVMWSGVVRLRDALAGVVKRGGRVRVITTTYMGATQRRAVDELVRIGAEVRVAFDARTTKLHAKAWLLERELGSDDGVHRLVEPVAHGAVRRAGVERAALDHRRAARHRAGAVDVRELLGVRALRAVRPRDGRGSARPRARRPPDRDAGASVSFIGLDVHPYPHQQRMLEQLTVERERHGRHRNLVVAATGTGKTVVAALDYRAAARERAGATSRCCSSRTASGSSSRAARRSARCFATARSARSTAAAESAAGRHVFAMIQSLSEEDVDRPATTRTSTSSIVDEFHHAAAPSYRRLLDASSPRSCSG